MDTIDRLTALFEHFPGIGPRQAGRFVQYLLRNPAVRRELADAVRDVGGAVHTCPDCQRFHAHERPLCGLCANPARDQNVLAIIASDADLSALERSGTYRGRYFVLGGMISLANEKTNGLRFNALRTHVGGHEQTYGEIILAFPANPEGDATATRIRDELATTVEQKNIRISTLGRGLSTGSELEYADPETLKSALANRT